MKGSVNIGLSGSYATWAGTVLDSDKPIVIVAEPGRQEEAAMRLGRIGFDSVVGYLRDGISALESRTDLMTGTTRVTPAEAADALARVKRRRLSSTSARRASGEIAHRGQREYPVESSRRADRGSARQPARARALRGWLSLIDRRGNAAARGPHRLDRAEWRDRCVGSRRTAGRAVR